MSLTYDENLALRRFCQEITYKPRPLDEQRTVRDGAFIWCEDWEIIEVLKFLFLGEESYMNEAPPRRLRGNPFFSKDTIRNQANALLNHHNRNMEAIIGSLREQRTAPRLG